MEENTIKKYKEKLEAEQKLLESELSTVSSKNPGNSADWEPKKADMDINQSDRNEVADDLEEFGNNTAITRDLEIRLEEVRRALGKINDGTYGFCEIKNEPIEEDRLEANPAARTCKEHMDSVL